MRRRDFLALTGAAIAAAPLPTRAQQAAKLPHIVILSLPQNDDRLQVLATALSGLGYTDGKTAIIETIIATIADTPAAAAQAVARKPDIIITSASPAPLALQAIGTTIPVVFANIVDPVALGLAASYAHPGGTMTGSMQGSPDIVGKQFDLLRELVPATKRVAVVGDPADAPYALLRDQVQAVTGALGIQTIAFDLKPGDDLPATMDRIAKSGADAIYAEMLNLVSADMPMLAPLAIARKLPMIGSAPQARQGALVGYSGNINEIVRVAATYVPAILRGARPGDLPIYQPSIFDFTINQKTATAIGITFPPSFAIEATEVIT